MKRKGRESSKIVKRFSGRKILVLLFAATLFQNSEIVACSSFKLQKGDSLVYGHNLNEGDMGVPGLIFINKRGIYKTGRTWSEIVTKDRLNPSGFSWISRYGSVTFNNFGRDFPDGGMNEQGLFIWEMNETIEYPMNENLPKLNQMNWMQYILDNCSSTAEAIECAYKFEIDGWGWHYFVGDKNGNTAAIAFINGEVVVHSGNKMPVPGLFNTPYDRELEVLKFYKGFGGDYEPSLNDPKVPRFVKTAVLARDYQSTQNIAEYGLKMLETLRVNDDPEWSILFDVRKQKIYFKTRVNPAVKTFAMNQIDFSNQTPTMIVNMDIEKGGNVFSQFEPFTNEKMESFTKNFIFPIFPAEFLTRGGITLDEYLQRTSTHTDLAKVGEKQFFRGIWKNNPKNPDEEISLTVKFEMDGESVRGTVSLGKEFIPIDHLIAIGKKMDFTFKTPKGTLLEVKANFADGKMVAEILGIEENYGTFELSKEN